MKKTAKILILFAAVSLTGCAAMYQKKDPMCAEIVNFANASEDFEIHSVELKTNWGVRIVGDRVEIGSKDCTHGGDEHAEGLCRYLLQHTSTEFSKKNFQRALACIANIPNFSRYAEIDRLNVKLWIDSIDGVKSNTRVGLEYSEGFNGSGASLKIFAQSENEE